LEALLEKNLANIKKTADRSQIDIFSEYKPFKIRTTEANYQAHAILGGIAPSYQSDDRIGMSLLINILGGPALNSRLNLSVREKYGLAYSVEASYSSFVDTGFWQIYYGCEGKNIDRAKDLIFKELNLISSRELSPIQLKRAKEQFKGHLALGMDSNNGLMQGLGKSMLAFNQIDTIDEIHQEIDKITSADLLRLAKSYFQDQVVSELIFDVE
jgi:predicted Zn-dependent peptidase